MENNDVIYRYTSTLRRAASFHDIEKFFFQFVFFILHEQTIRKTLKIFPHSFL